MPRRTKPLCEACQHIADERAPFSPGAVRRHFQSVSDHFKSGAIKTYVMNAKDGERLEVLLAMVRNI